MSLEGLDLTGRIIDRRFRIERKLGSGGMGTVWRARHLQSLQYFALKTLRISNELPESTIRRCLKEARAAASLKSRHVVRVTDVQSDYQHDGVPLPYLVMELLEGTDLESVLNQRKALKVAETAWVMRQLCRGIQLAHAYGVIHRDLKPANLFLTTDDDGLPVVKICDFGLAKIADTCAPGYSLESSVRTGAIAGTPRYMAPEQLRGSTQATTALDQWAIGLIAYRLLSGQDYFDGAHGALELSLRIIHDQLPAPSCCSHLVSSTFDEWFFRSCNRNPEARYVSVQEQADALQRALGDPVEVAIGAASLSGNAVSVAETVSSSNAALESLPSKAATRARKGGLTGVGFWAVSGVLVTLALAACLQLLAVSRFGATPNITTGSVARASNEDGVASPKGPSTTEVMKPESAAASAAAAAARVEPKSTPVHGRRVERRRPAPATPVGDTAPPLPSSTSLATSPPMSQSVGRESGVSCTRSSQCESRLCVAERCR